MLVSAMVKSAMVEAGALDASASPTGAEMVDGVNAFNQLLFALRGNGIGPSLKNTALDASATAQNGRAYMVDARTTEITLTLPEDPQDGDRVGVNDARGKFSVHNFTIAPNGQLIGDQSGTSGNSLILTAKGDNRRFTFLAERGWMAESNLAAGDQCYYSPEVNQGLIYMLAGRFAVSYGMPVTPQLAQATSDAWATIVRRYGRKGRNQKIPPVGIVTPSTPARTQ